MRWVDTRYHAGLRSVCSNCGYMESYLGWGEPYPSDGGYGKKKKHFYPKLEKNEDTGN